MCHERASQSVELEIDDNTIISVPHLYYLRVQIDDHLCWDAHQKKVPQKAIAQNTCGCGGSEARRIILTGTIGACAAWVRCIYVKKECKIVDRIHKSMTLTYSRLYWTVSCLPVSFISAWLPLEYKIMC